MQNIKFTRQSVGVVNWRTMGSDHSIEVFVDTPLAVWEERDCKGMYAGVRRREIRGPTGIDDPYKALDT